jgi:hypothetical protein
MGTDENTIVEIFTNHTLDQLRQVANAYDSAFNASLESAVESEFSGDLKYALLALMSDPIDSFCRSLKNALSGLGTDELTVNRVIAGNDKKTVHAIADRYFKKYDKDLCVELNKELSGDYENCVVTYVRAQDITNGVEDDLVEQSAAEIERRLLIQQREAEEYLEAANAAAALRAELANIKTMMFERAFVANGSITTEEHEREVAITNLNVNENGIDTEDATERGKLRADKLEKEVARLKADIAAANKAKDDERLRYKEVEAELRRVKAEVEASERGKLRADKLEKEVARLKADIAAANKAKDDERLRYKEVEAEFRRVKAEVEASERGKVSAYHWKSSSDGEGRYTKEEAKATQVCSEKTQLPSHAESDNNIMEEKQEKETKPEEKKEKKIEYANMNPVARALKNAAKNVVYREIY